MDIIRSLKAFLYCVGQNTNNHAVSSNIDGDVYHRWLSLRAALEATEIPVYLIAAEETYQPKSLDGAKFNFSASAHSKEQLSILLSEPSLSSPTSVLIAGYYAETLITDVALSTLREGYDTFVIWDRVWAISEAGLEAAKSRLLQAGAVPTCVDQVLHRWG